MKNINLGVYCFPGGTSFCDRNRTESGDYKELAFVRAYGQINYKTPREKIPADVIKKIEQEARETRRKFEEQTRRDWQLDRIRSYSRLVDYLSLNDALKVFNEKDPEQQLEMIIQAYEKPYAYEVTIK